MEKIRKNSSGSRKLAWEGSWGEQKRFIYSGQIMIKAQPGENILYTNGSTFIYLIVTYRTEPFLPKPNSLNITENINAWNDSYKCEKRFVNCLQTPLYEIL